jgi:hypothetical protein
MSDDFGYWDVFPSMLRVGGAITAEDYEQAKTKVLA